MATDQPPCQQSDWQAGESPPSSWPASLANRQAPAGNSPDQQDDLNIVVAQARGFIYNLAALVNEINQLRVKRSSLEYENQGLVADNQRLQKEIDILEDKMALLEERMEKLETEGKGSDASPIGKLPLGSDSHVDQVERDFLAQLSITPRDWFMDKAEYGDCPVRQEVSVDGNRKKVVTMTPLDVADQLSLRLPQPLRHAVHRACLKIQNYDPQVRGHILVACGLSLED